MFTDENFDPVIVSIGIIQCYHCLQHLSYIQSCLKSLPFISARVTAVKYKSYNDPSLWYTFQWLPLFVWKNSKFPKMTQNVFMSWPLLSLQTPGWHPPASTHSHLNHCWFSVCSYLNQMFVLIVLICLICLSCSICPKCYSHNFIGLP